MVTVGYKSDGSECKLIEVGVNKRIKPLPPRELVISCVASKFYEEGKLKVYCVPWKIPLKWTGKYHGKAAMD